MAEIKFEKKGILFKMDLKTILKCPIIIGICQTAEKILIIEPDFVKILIFSHMKISRFLKNFFSKFTVLLEYSYLFKTSHFFL